MFALTILRVIAVSTVTLLMSYNGRLTSLMTLDLNPESCQSCQSSKCRSSAFYLSDILCSYTIISNMVDLSFVGSS